MSMGSSGINLIDRVVLKHPLHDKEQFLFKGGLISIYLKTDTFMKSCDKNIENLLFVKSFQCICIAVERMNKVPTK